MKTFLYISLIFTPVCFAMDFEDTRNLETLAWKSAFNGDFEHAKSVFEQIVQNKKSEIDAWNAAMILSTDFATGEIFGIQDQSLSEKYKKIAQSVYKHEYKYFNNETEVASHIKSLRNLKLAQQNPWYKNILSKLIEESFLSYRSPIISKSPEESIIELFNIYMNCSYEKKDERVQHYVNLISEGLRHLDQKSKNRVCEHVVNQMTTSWSFRQKDYELFFPFVAEWTAVHKKEKLTTLYDHIIAYNIEEYRDDVRDSKESEISNKIFEYIPRYYEVDQKHALFSLNHFLEFFEECGLEDHNDYIKFIALLHSLKPDEFEKHAAKIKKNARALSQFMSHAFAHEDVHQPLMHTSLNLQTLITSLFQSTFEQHEDCSAFGTLLTAGQKLHEHYMPQLIEVLPRFLNKVYYYNRSVLTLLDSPLHNLKKVAIDTLINVQQPLYHEESYWHEFFEKVSTSLNKDEKRYVYAAIDTVAQKKNTSLLLQKFWQELDNQPDYVDILHHSIDSYFNVDTQNCNSTALKELLAVSLCDAIDQQTIESSRFDEFFMTGHVTDINNLIAPELLYKYQENAIIDESKSFFVRAQLLDNYVFQWLHQEKLSDKLKLHVIKAIVDKIPAAEFKEYAENFYICLQEQKWFDHYAAKRKVRDMRKKYKECNETVLFSRELPESILETSGGLYNACDDFKYEVQNKPGISTIIKKDLKQLTFDGDLMFGFVGKEFPYTQWIEKDTFALYACDKKTGDIVWKMPTNIPHTTEMYHTEIPFAIGEKNIFFVPADKSNEMVRCDKQKGNPYATLKMLNNFPILFLGINCHNKLFMVQDNEQKEEETITLYNPDTFSHYFQKNIKSSSRKMKFSIAHDHLCRYESDSQNIILTNEEGSETILPTWLVKESESPKEIIKQNSHHFFYQEGVSYMACKNLFYFMLQQADNTQHVVCFDTNKKQTLWHYPFSENLRVAPCIDPQNNTVYLAGNKAITALAAITSHDQAQLLWQTKLNDNEHNKYYDDRIRSLAVHDKSLYCIDTDGELNIVDTKSGQLKFLEKLPKQYHVKHISNDGTPYLQ